MTAAAVTGISNASCEAVVVTADQRISEGKLPRDRNIPLKEQSVSSARLAHRGISDGPVTFELEEEGSMVLRPEQTVK